MHDILRTLISSCVHFCGKRFIYFNVWHIIMNIYSFSEKLIIHIRIFSDFCTLFFQDDDIDEYRKTLRMAPHVHDKLLHMLSPGLTKKHTNFRPPIPARVRLGVTLRYLALGDCFISISQQFRIGLSTVREIVRETCQVIIRTMQPLYLRTPTTEGQWLAISNHFRDRWNFDHVIGCVDGKHIRIAQPYKSGSF